MDLARILMVLFSPPVVFMAMPLVSRIRWLRDRWKRLMVTSMWLLSSANAGALAATVSVDAGGQAAEIALRAGVALTGIFLVGWGFAAELSFLTRRAR